MAQNPYRLVEDDNSSLMDTIYYERDGRLPTFKISALLPNREERFGVYEIKIDKKTIAVLDFAMPGGLVTFYNKPAIAMGVFMDYAAPSRECAQFSFLECCAFGAPLCHPPHSAHFSSLSLFSSRCLGSTQERSR